MDKKLDPLWETCDLKDCQICPDCREKMEPVSATMGNVLQAVKVNEEVGESTIEYSLAQFWQNIKHIHQHKCQQANTWFWRIHWYQDLGGITRWVFRNVLEEVVQNDKTQTLNVKHFAQPRWGGAVQSVDDENGTYTSLF
jgi:hypothetical protein